MAIFNGKIKTRYGEYTMSTKYKALILLSKNVNVSKWFTDTYSNRGFIFMDLDSDFGDIHDALNINWPDRYISVILVGDAENDYKDNSEFRKLYDKYFRYVSGIYLDKGLLDPSQWERVEGMIMNSPYVQGEVFGWFNCAISRDNEL